MAFLKQELTKNGGNYLNKFKEGDTKIRIVSDAIQGWEGWQNSKPVRRTLDNPFTMEERKTLDTNEKGAVQCKEFVACKVYNHDDNAVQIMLLTKPSIINAINKIASDSEMGEIDSYDIKITREGSGFDTEYSVRALPPKPLPKEAQELIDNTKVNLDALFDGGNPFEV